MKIFLIGMPGSGKSTLGRELATHLQVDFVDLDSEIEKFERKSIPEIFNQHGEVHFRLSESRLLLQWAGGTYPFVMATGGGAPCFFRGMETINKNGLSIFLDVPVPELIARVKQNKERPLLLTSDENRLKEKLQALRNQRLACYQQAKIIIENPSMEAVLKSLKL